MAHKQEVMIDSMQRVSKFVPKNVFPWQKELRLEGNKQMGEYKEKTMHVSRLSKEELDKEGRRAYTSIVMKFILIVINARSYLLF